MERLMSDISSEIHPSEIAVFKEDADWMLDMTLNVCDFKRRSGCILHKSDYTSAELARFQPDDVILNSSNLEWNDWACLLISCDDGVREEDVGVVKYLIEYCESGVSTRQFRMMARTC
jgi:hypothetical protein